MGQIADLATAWRMNEAGSSVCMPDFAGTNAKNAANANAPITHTTTTDCPIASTVSDSTYR